MIEIYQVNHFLFNNKIFLLFYSNRRISLNNVGHTFQNNEIYGKKLTELH